MLRVVKNAVGIQRPMPASGRLKAEEGAYGKVGNSLRLLSFMVEFDSMISQHALHFAQVGFTVVAEITADVFGSRSQQHRKDRLTALQVGRFMDILNVHGSSASSVRYLGHEDRKGCIVKKERMQPFLWYNVIVKKQNSQEHYTAYQLKLPVEIEKIIEISDPVYSFSEVMDHIDLNKYLTIEERRPGRPRYDQKTLLKIILFAFMENGYASVREIEKYCKTDIRYMWLLQDNPPPSHMTIAIIIISTAKNTAWKNS